jgi:hypothetical protein
MFTPNEANNLLMFLDRVLVTGHKERGEMTSLVNKIAVALNPPMPDKQPDAGAKRSGNDAD